MAARVFKKGEIISGVKIVRLVKLDENNNERSEYSIEHLCCGRKGRLKKGTISRRENENILFCFFCSREKNIGLSLTAIREKKEAAVVAGAFSLMNAAVNNQKCAAL